ncbi:hypothetical protein PI124_g18210 [Phytophthora idaei]|nr:hypothetical protein PI125_g18846 [Phytophthora idaei]KAG3136204.1 hypothetical protein PI126_g17914 [Phytophthora idaei]KAG3236786.1 hypothetical protein PI124_g18210 [Phytophthora idaei]
MYDSDRFLSAMAKWAQGPDSDDPNHCSTESEIDELDEVDTEEYITEVMNNELKLPTDSSEDLDDSDLFEDVADEDWSPREDVNIDPELLSDVELKAIASDWVVYDQDHNGDFQGDNTTDLYSGRWGPTASARAYAEPPLAMFYYFLPNVMWVNIAEESNRYRESVIASVATQQQQRQQWWQATHPNSRVQPLAYIKVVLRKAKPFQPHEVAHDIGLLIARVLCPQ